VCGADMSRSTYGYSLQYSQGMITPISQELRVMGAGRHHSIKTASSLSGTRLSQLAGGYS
jgi:hypothetical protein